MGIYYITLVLIVFFSICAVGLQNHINTLSYNYTWKTKNVFVWCIAALLIFFAGFRYQVGSDWYAYYSLKHEDFREVLTTTFLEPGWYSLGYISTSLYNEQGVAMFFAAMVTIFLYIRTISKYSHSFLLSILLYFFLVWHGCFNGVRQYLAAAILFSGHRYLFEQKFYKWILVVLLASMFHTTAIIMFPLFWIVDRKLNTQIFIFVLVLGLVLLFSYDRIYDFISFYKEKDLNTEGVYMSKQVSSMRILINWIPVLFYKMIVARKQDEFYNREVNFYAILTLINAVLMTAAMNSAYLARVGVYTGCFNLLVWPIFLSYLTGKYKQFMFVCLVLFYGMYWFYDIYVHPDLNNFKLLFCK